MNVSDCIQKSGRPRILCISPWFAPRLNSEAFCSAKFVNALAEQGADVTVIAYTNTKQGIVDSSDIWEAIRARVIQIETPSQNNPFDSIKNAIRYQTWLWARWVNIAVSEVRRIHQKSPFDLVYSRSLPMFGQIAGFWCAKILDRPWIANLNDPWDFHLFPVGSGIESSSSDNQLSNFWMRRTFQRADLITYPSDRLRSYQAKVTNINHHYQIVPHVGLRFSERERNLRITAPKELHLVHAGKLGSNEFTGRSTRALLQGIRMFLDCTPNAKGIIKLSLVGPEDTVTQTHVYDLGLQDVVKSVGQTNYVESLRFIQCADVCVLVEADMPEGIFLPSKFVDYIFSEKPVLALSPANGVVADMVSGGGIIRLSADDAVGIRDALISFSNDLCNGTLDQRAPRGFQVEQFRPESIAKRFLDSVDELIRTWESY